MINSLKKLQEFLELQITLFAHLSRIFDKKLQCTNDLYVT